MSDIALDQRGQEILGAVVEQYVRSGEPVGSRTLAQKSSEHLSAATIRNTMADLEQLGLLEQPHTSAGRIPTELGYRVYVNNLMRGHPIARADEQFIHASLGQPVTDAAALFGQVSRVLSQLTNQIGVVITPNVSRVRLRHLEFVQLASRRVVAILVAETGIIHNKVFETEDEYAQDQLDRAGRFLTETFQGMTLPETRERIVAMMAEEKALYDRLLKDAITLAQASVDQMPEEPTERHVFVEGTSNLLDSPDFADAERLKAIFRTFEEKHRILRILNRCLEEGHPGVKVLIGSETDLPELNQCTLITSAYGPEGQPLGALGVLGPTRMEYAKAVALVDYVSRFFGTLLKPYTL
ncbi:MAG: heat-inducible transcription repressor HrcA [Acidobacteria bacterium]|nr:heat-inducible transcription repressor HrcA [Acidobacteriota bacterium]